MASINLKALALAGPQQQIVLQSPVIRRFAAHIISGSAASKRWGAKSAPTVVVTAFAKRISLRQAPRACGEPSAENGHRPANPAASHMPVAMKTRTAPGIPAMPSASAIIGNQ